MSFNSKYTGQEVEDKLDELQNITATDQEFRYKSNKVWHAGNDGEESGLDADTLDGRHAGVSVGSVVYYIDMPDSNNLVDLGYLAENVKNVSTEYSKALCKWVASNYHNKQNDVILQGIANPNSRGWCVIHLYKESQSENPNEEGLPKYCSGIYQRAIEITNSIARFGTWNYNFYHKYILDESFVLEDNFAYWYENNENQSTTTCNRGGNRNVIESLRSKFKRCIAKPYGDDAALISFCNESNSNI